MLEKREDALSEASQEPLFRAISLRVPTAVSPNAGEMLHRVTAVVHCHLE